MIQTALYASGTPRTLGQVTDLPDEQTLRHMLALLSASDGGGADAAA